MVKILQMVPMMAYIPSMVTIPRTVTILKKRLPHCPFYPCLAPFLANFAPYGPNWPRLTLFGPVYSHLAPLAQCRPVWPYFAPFGSIVPCLAQFAPFVLIVLPCRINLYERKGLEGTPEDYLLEKDGRLKKGLRTMSTIQVRNVKKVQ